MSDFSIELAIRKIVDRRSVKHFDEVYRCYVNGCYRAATVMLWTAVICDLYYKLDELATIHSDPTAVSILAKVTAIQATKDKSPEWERILLDEVATRTELVTSADHASLINLQQHRHLSAHPALDGHEFLFDPSQDVVRAHRRVVLDAVLTKPALMTRKIITSLLEDIADFGPKLPDDEPFSKLLRARYLDRLGPAAFQQVFRDLWRICFRVSSPEAVINRPQNLRALISMMRLRQVQLLEAIYQDESYSHLSSEDDIQETFIKFLQHFPGTYEKLKGEAKALVEAKAIQDFDTFCVCPFLSDTLSQHIKECTRKVLDSFEKPSYSAMTFLRKISESPEEKLCLNRLAIESYGRSGSYVQANETFKGLVEPILSDLKEDEQVRLLELHNSNWQCKTNYWAPGFLASIHESLGDEKDAILEKVQNL